MGLYTAFDITTSRPLADMQWVSWTPEVMLGLFTASFVGEAFRLRRDRGQSRGATIFMGCILAAMWGIGGLITLGFYTEYFDLQAAMRAGRYEIVEGCLEGFHPMPETGHDQERLKVRGRRFEYSDFVITPAYHNAEALGGYIHRDSYVKIFYVGDDIVRLDVADRACPPQMQDLARAEP